MGKNETLARDVMSQNLIVIRPEQTYREAVELLTRHRLTGLPVVDRAGKLVGILSEKDILARCKSFDLGKPDFLGARIRYRSPVRSVTEATPLDEVGALLSGKSFRHVPVVDLKGKLTGIITRRDLIRVLYLRLELARSPER